MAGSGDPQLETLIAAQKEIINATWNIERRSSGGPVGGRRQGGRRRRRPSCATARRADDARAGAAVGLPGAAADRRLRPGPRRGRPARDAGGVGGDVDGPRGAAARTARRRRRRSRTRWRRSRGCCRRRRRSGAGRCAQQASGASGNGGGRQGQDLSALFDKELQRQQRTNYETRSQIEERPDAEAARTARSIGSAISRGGRRT